MRGRFVSEPARSKVHTYPNAVLFVGEYINIVISTADSPKLIPRHLLESRDRRNFPCLVLEQFMIDSGFRFSPDAERNFSHDVVHDRFDFWGNFTALRVGENGEITARDIEPDSGKRNSVFVGDNSTNRLGVTFVAIRAK